VYEAHPNTVRAECVSLKHSSFQSVIGSYLLLKYKCIKPNVLRVKKKK